MVFKTKNFCNVSKAFSDSFLLYAPHDHMLLLMNFNGKVVLSWVKNTLQNDLTSYCRPAHVVFSAATFHSKRSTSRSCVANNNFTSHRGDSFKSCKLSATDISFALAMLNRSGKSFLRGQSLHHSS